MASVIVPGRSASTAEDDTLMYWALPACLWQVLSDTSNVSISCQCAVRPGDGCLSILDKQCRHDVIAGSIYLGSSRVRLYNFRYKCTAAWVIYVDAGRLAMPTSTQSFVLACAERYRFCRRCSPMLIAIYTAGLVPPKQNTTRCWWCPEWLPQVTRWHQQGTHVYGVVKANH